MSRPDDPRPADPTADVTADPAAGPADAESEPIDAEIVETETAGTSPVPVAPPAPGTPTAAGYTDEGVPTLDYVRDKIESRAATAAGWQELTGDTEAGRDVEEKFAEREQKAKDRLEEIRRSMGL
ncbi:hypothetical protein GCM10010472_68920 [Pseudonocardia halophobica]|uniref:PspA domain-containing protein n=1 Tax=Pseudonocardia halophobica TaxID=29401 RepID=A0A9W6LB05_9PSEU|nr:hypothetical protein [Pseudonocardia halophobica]GLL14825.1 hypothetical protein GCM10017577_59740 [Pseudonocardia halophobica]